MNEIRLAPHADPRARYPRAKRAARRLPTNTLWSLVAFGAARLRRPGSIAGSTMPRPDGMSIGLKIQEPKFAEPMARPAGAMLRIAAKLVSDPNNSPCGAQSKRGLVQTRLAPQTSTSPYPLASPLLSPARTGGIEPGSGYGHPCRAGHFFVFSLRSFSAQAQ